MLKKKKMLPNKKKKDEQLFENSYIDLGIPTGSEEFLMRGVGVGAGNLDFLFVSPKQGC